MAVSNGLGASVLLVARARDEQLRALEQQTEDRSTFEVVDAAGGFAAAVASARGRIVIFLGENLVPEPGFVRGHLEGLAAEEHDFGIGAVTADAPSAAAAVWNGLRDLTHAERSGWPTLPAANLSATRAALTALGDPAGVSVDEIALRLEAAGRRARYLPRAGARRLGSLTPRVLVAERAREGAAHAALVARHPDATSRLVGRSLEASPLELLLRRLFFAIPVGAFALAALGALAPGDDLERRWLAFVSSLAYWRAVKRAVPRVAWEQCARGVPVLLYHAFGRTERPTRFVVRRRTFARQMKLLSVLGFRALAYGEFTALLAGGELPAPRTVVVTIDDGYADNVEAAAILAEHGFAATIFVVADRVDGANDWSDGPPLRGRRLLSREQVAALRRSGMEVGAHTRTHPSLPELDAAGLRDEVAASRAGLEAMVAEPVATFAYPYGRFDRRAVMAVADAGFVGACTTRPRLARLDDDPLLVPRLEIRGTDSLARFFLKVWFGAA